jgi:hypothetical protein
MHQLLVTLHSYNRFLLLAAALFVLFRAFSGWLGRKPYTRADNGASAALLGLTHLQALLGLLLYFFTSAWTRGLFNGEGVDMKNALQRYFAVEHIAGMLIAVVLIQLGRTFSKRAQSDERKHRLLAIYTLIAVLIVVGTLAPRGLLFGSVNNLIGN